MFEIQEIDSESAVNDAINPIIAEAEALYGRRIPGYEQIQVEFRDDIRGPSISFMPGTAKIMIRSSVRENLREAFCECAHEVIHLLSPFYYGTDVTTGTVLEEGLATHFQAKIFQEWPTPTSIIFNPKFAEYNEAWSVVKILLDLNPEAIRELRTSQTTIALIEEAEILRVAPGLPLDVARILVMPLSQLKETMMVTKSE